MTLPASGRLDSRCRLTLPKAMRDALGLQPNDSVIFLIEGDSVSMRRRPQSFTKALAGLHQEVWKRRDEWLENKRLGWEQGRPRA